MSLANFIFPLCSETYIFHICTYIYIYIYIVVVCVYVYISIHIYIYIYRYIPVPMRKCTYMCIYVYIYISVCVYIYSVCPIANTRICESCSNHFQWRPHLRTDIETKTIPRTVCFTFCAQTWWKQDFPSHLQASVASLKFLYIYIYIYINI